jgi:hypothetical protein
MVIGEFCRFSFSFWFFTDNIFFAPKFFTHRPQPGLHAVSSCMGLEKIYWANTVGLAGPITSTQINSAHIILLSAR